MRIESHTARPPNLVRAIEELSLHADQEKKSQSLLHELAGITVLVARKFTNDRTADGLLEAYYLTTGCVSLGIAQADITHDGNSELAFLLDNGAEQVFQKGFRYIRELAGLPPHTMVADFDSDPVIQQRNIKALFLELCRAETNTAWTGDERFKNELAIRRENQDIIECAKWLRKNHWAGPIRDPDLDASAVIGIAVIFAITGDGRIHARIGQRDIEQLIRKVREKKPDIDEGWHQLLKAAPPMYQPILRMRMDEFKNTIVKKILSRTAIKTVVTEIQNCYAGVEQDVEYD